MYIGFLHLHNTLRWLLLLSLLVTLIKYTMGWFGNQPWKKIDRILGLVFIWLMDIQLFTGLALYFFISPITKMALANFGAAMKDDTLRFYAVEHITVMVIAVILVHIGWEKSKKARTDIAKFKLLSVFFLIALMMLIAAIPWSRL
jgi:hypothetical protein